MARVHAQGLVIDAVLRHWRLTGVPLDDLAPILHACHQADLAVILELTPYTKRVPVALAFSDLDMAKWARLAGFHVPTVYRWIMQENRLPFGAALRLARVIGADAAVLFKGYL